VGLTYLLFRFSLQNSFILARQLITCTPNSDHKYFNWNSNISSTLAYWLEGEEHFRLCRRVTAIEIVSKNRFSNHGSFLVFALYDEVFEVDEKKP